MNDHRLNLRQSYDLTHLLCRGYAVEHHDCPCSLCHLCFRAALAHTKRRHREQCYRRSHQSHPRQDFGYFRPALGIPFLRCSRYDWAYYDGCV